MDANKEKKLSIMKIAVIALLFLIASFSFRTRMGAEDFTAFLKWWFALLVIGIGFMPLTAYMFKNFRDKGWLFSKTIALAASGWLVWYLSSFKIIKFTVANCFIFTAVLIVLNIVFFVLVDRRDRKFNEGKLANEQLFSFGKFSWDTITSITLTEFMFFLGFLFWTYLRCFKPEIMGNTEKFMDYGLMTSIDRAIYMPAEDIWLSGHTINYYYLGQYLGVFVKRLSGVAIEDSYNLALMMIAGFAFAMPYSIMNQVASDFILKKKVGTRAGKGFVEDKPEKWYTVVVGLLAGLSVCFAGNLHYTIFNYIAVFGTDGKLAGLKKLLSVTRDSYWFPDATRYIGYNPDTDDKTIHEFPSYSFVLGDLHAHVINIMFVLTVIALLYTILQARRARMDKFRYESFDAIPGYDIKNKADCKAMLFEEVLTPQVLLIGFFIGFFHMTNYWDYPIYFVVSGAIILFSNAVICRFRKETIFMTAAHAAVILAISFIVSLPFKLTFDQISTGVAISLKHTPLYQLAILWGLPITVVIVFLVLMIKELNRSFGKRKKNSSKKDKENPNKPSISKFCDDHSVLDWLYRMINSLEIADLFVLTIGLCACGLILMPELVYVRDIYSGAYKRANTMFKLTYQAYIMFGMAMPYIIARLIRFSQKRAQHIFAIISLCLLVSTYGYFFNASKAWFGDYSNPEKYKGLDCVVWMDKYSKEDYEAVNWINKNITEPEVMLEGVGFSYTYYERISATTGLATIMGWETHEWLWRSEANFNKPDIIPERQKAVKTIYTSNDKEEVMELLKKYDVDYIYVGEAERFDGMRTGSAGDEGFVKNDADGRYYAHLEVNDELIRSLGDVIYQAVDENGSELDAKGEFRTYIVKINK